MVEDLYLDKLYSDDHITNVRLGLYSIKIHRGGKCLLFLSYVQY